LWTLAGATFAAVAVDGLLHFFRDDLSEAEGGPAGGVFFEAVVSLDDFDIDAVRQVLEGPSSIADEFHRDVDRHAHARCDQERGDLTDCHRGLALLWRQTGGCDDEWNPTFFADLGDIEQSFGGTKIDDDVGSLGEVFGNRNADGADAGDFTGITSQKAGVIRSIGADNMKIASLAGEDDKPSPHSTCCSIDPEFDAL
jgi:hypothetical protein